jgi:hypothetical protein
MFQKKMLIISTSIAVALTVAGQANADVTIIHDADGGTQVQAGKVKVSTGVNGGSQVETGQIRLSTDEAFLVSRRSKYRRYGKPAIPTVKVPNAKIPPIPVVRSPGFKIPPISTTTTKVPTVIQRNETYSNGGVYSTRTTTRTSNGSSSNSQTTVIRGDGHSHTNSNHDSDD